MIAWNAVAPWRRWSGGRSIGALPLWLRRSYGLSSSFLKVSEEVQDAVVAGRPVIALETTIYTHGIFSPVCLDYAQILLLINSGVHRGGEVSMDISADLTELGRTPVTVISSGCKSFLDIPRTLEYLETQGVCVGTFADGRNGPIDFPAFFSRESGVRSPRVIQDEAEAAAIVHAQLKLHLSSGIHFANPVPEQYSMPKYEMDEVIAEALRCADLEGFHGSDNTPYVLSKIKELSGSRSVAANKGLIESNVKRATKVAVELMKLEQSFQRRPDQIEQNLGGVGHNVALAASYVGSSVAFCSVVADDLNGQAAMSMLRREKLNTMGIQILPPMLGLRTAQYIAINDRKKNLVLGMADMGILELSDRDLSFDTFWDPIFMRTKPDWLVVDANWSPGVLARWVTSARKHGARIAFEPVSTTKATRIFSKISTPAETTAVIDFSDSFPNHLIDLAAPNSMELASMHSAARDAGLFDSSGWWHVIDGLGMSNAGSRERLISVTSKSLVDQGIPQQSIQLLPFMPCILTKLGSQGVLVSQLLQPNDPRLTCPDAAPYILGRAPSQDGLVGGVYLRLFAPDQVLTGEEVVSVNGAGDTLLGVVIAGLARELGKNEERRLENIISVAQKASIKTLKSPDSVNADIKNLAMLFK
ncbi:hypothetical protein Egran_03314 [Elaphomyces granulatus]|uniref:Carbohydrate kinase PfkB domain-containing protein n=1 Tax=Elaphomyces granulatus TaxID=519963 RepID=A0A232LXM0_9EURO|nr:hypothetical protein Egran_03314 [Elaphomyces granulatus]